MSNPSGSDENTQAGAEPEADASAGAPVEADEPESAIPERRFTAPSSFDAGKTQVIETASEPATEVLSFADAPAGAAAPTEPIASSGPAAPQLIPGRTEPAKPARRRGSWGWVIAVILVIAALVAVAILGTVLLTHEEPAKVSQEDQVRTTIQNFDTAIQKGDLATLRGITCGETAEAYIRFDDKQWKDVHSRVAAARQYPVVATINQVVVHETHAEANVETFMAFDPSTRSTRSFDLQFRDNQWKICQSPQ